MDKAAFVRATIELGFDLSSEQVDAFEAYEEALYEANLTRNLTRVPREECWVRHFVDSLLCHDLFPTGSSVLDIGTGPGLPAWPLACARPDLHVTAVDSSQKMVGFLASMPLRNLRTVLTRGEELREREVFDIVTGRAVAPLPAQVELSAAPCKIGGAVVPMRTGQDSLLSPSALGMLGLKQEAVHRRILPVIEAERVFPVLRKTGATASKYPRAWAEMTRRPLK